MALNSINTFMKGSAEGLFPQDPVELACSAAESFTKIYFENLDKKRLLLPKLYLDNAALVWNGNGFSGRDSIVEHLQNLPASHHTILSLDAQKVPELATGNRPAFIVQVFGYVKYEIFNDKRSFHQNFMIVSDEENKWRIASDCMRIQESISS